MKRSTRSLAVALSASVAFGIAAPAAMAASGGHDRSVIVKASHSKPVKAAKPGKMNHELRQVLHAVSIKDAAFVRVVKVSRLASIGSEVRAEFVENVAVERVALADLKLSAQAADATVSLRKIRNDLRLRCAEVYVLILNDLRQAERIQTRAAAYDVALEELAAAGADTTMAIAANEVAKTAVASAVEEALTLDSTSGKLALRLVHRALVSALKALDAVAGAIDGFDANDDEPTEPTEPTEPVA